MSLLTYNDVRPWARAIKDRTQQRTMPPWFIEKDVGAIGAVICKDDNIWNSDCFVPGQPFQDERALVFHAGCQKYAGAHGDRFGGAVHPETEEDVGCGM